MASIVNFAQVLTAAVHKGQAPALLADSIRDAAAAYAKNAGAKNTLTAIAAACVTSPEGKTRSPAAGTVGALILQALQNIIATADSAGARPAPDATTEQRETAAAAFSAMQRGAYVAACDAAAAARKALADSRKAEKTAAAASSAAAAAALGVNTAATKPDGTEIDAASPAALLAELDALKNAAAQRDAALAECARLQGIIDALRIDVETAQAAATMAQGELAAIEQAKMRATAAAAEAAAAAHVITATMLAPTLPQQRKARKARETAAA